MRGVKIRISAPLDETTKEAEEKLGNIAEVKNITHVTARFCVVDGKDLLFMVMHDEEVHPTYDIGVWVNTPFFASALENTFNSEWKKV